MKFTRIAQSLFQYDVVARIDFLLISLSRVSYVSCVFLVLQGAVFQTRSIAANLCNFEWVYVRISYYTSMLVFQKSYFISQACILKILSDVLVLFDVGFYIRSFDIRYWTLNLETLRHCKSYHFQYQASRILEHRKY